MRDLQDGHAIGALVRSPEEDPVTTRTPSQVPASAEAEVGAHRGYGCGQVIGGTAGNNAWLTLQRHHGNRYVQRVVDLSLAVEGESVAPPDVQQAIESSRGGGRPLDSTVRAQMGRAFNADFGGVRVHADGQADALNRSLNAKAFTTGKDVFFREGEYNPGSSSGRQLLAHELTHVVQQNPDTVQRRDDELPSGVDGAGEVARSVQTKLTVGRPGDIYEQEADQMAQAFPAWEQRATQTPDAAHALRRLMPEEEKKEEPMVRTKPVEATLSRQSEEEKKEGMLQTKLVGDGLQRALAEEEKE